MNQERKNKLIAAIRAETYRLNMETWRAEFTCGTVVCIGGHCEMLLEAESALEPEWSTTKSKRAAEWLEIDHKVAHALFFPFGLRSWHLITRADAIQAIENVDKNGDPDWKTVRPDLAL